MKAYIYSRGNYFFHMMRLVRLCTLYGHIGSGRTTMAVALAANLCKLNGLTSVYTNERLLPPIPVTDNPIAENSLMLINNHICGLTGKAKRLLAINARQRNRMFIFTEYDVPETGIPHGELAIQRVYRVLHYIWVYRWTFKDSILENSGYILLINPGAIWKLYDTLYIGDDVSKILADYIESRRPNLFKHE